MTIINYYTNINKLASSLSLSTLLLFNLKSQSILASYIYNYTLKINNNDKYKTIKAYKNDNLILSLNYYFTNDNIKIEYLNINNDYYTNKFNKKKILTDDEFILLKNALFDYIENEAYNNNKTKIIIDIHNNLERYYYELEVLGFIKTERRCIDNYFWFEAEKMINYIK